MSDSREAFEQLHAIPSGAIWCEKRHIYIHKNYSGLVLHPINESWEAFCEGALWQAGRQALEGDVITDLKAEIRTERDPSDEYDSFLVFVNGGKSEPYLFIPETLDDTVLDEVVKRINTHPASAAKQAVSVPSILYDGYAVFQEVQHARNSEGLENIKDSALVSDVLDAVVKLIKQEQDQ